jgi:predicted DNA-binding transcriptional regulator AlpA
VAWLQSEVLEWIELRVKFRTVKHSHKPRLR